MKSQDIFSVEFDDFSVGYFQLPIIENLNLDIVKGERLCILGPSGGGKTTLLNAITGVLDFGTGVFKKGMMRIKAAKGLHKQHFNIGYVFQDLALFPHLDVWGNVAFPLKLQQLGGHVIEEKVSAMLDLLHIADKKNAKIATLSGGQKQRVALARALVVEPDILCMDEALKGMDPVLKMSFLEKLIDIQKQFKFTLIYVTHDRDEANFCADRICILDKGKVLQVDTPENIYHSPANLEVAFFIGEANAFSLKSLPKLRDILSAKFPAAQNPDTAVFRPEDITIEDKAENQTPISRDNKLVLTGEVILSQFMGRSYKSYLMTGQNKELIEGPRLSLKAIISISIPFGKLLIY